MNPPCLLLLVVLFPLLQLPAVSIARQRVYIGGLFQPSRTEGTIRAFLMALDEAAIDSFVQKRFPVVPPRPHHRLPRAPLWTAIGGPPPHS